MGVVNQNPLIERYYYPLGTERNFDAIRKDIAKVRDEVIHSLEQKLLRAQRDERKDEMDALQAALSELRVSDNV